jgi:hypothetical protein
MAVRTSAECHQVFATFDVGVVVGLRRFASDREQRGWNGHNGNESNAGKVIHKRLDR